MEIIEPVEPAYLVRTVIGAVSRSDTPVVHLLIQPLFAMDRCKHGADSFTRGVRTMLAHHRLMGYIQLAVVLNEIPVYPNPMEFAIPVDLIFSDHWNVVFRLTAYHTRRTAGTGVQIDHHPPVRPIVFMLFRPHAA